MTQPYDVKRAEAALATAELRLTPAERAKRRQAGQLRKRALSETGARSYRALRARLHDGDDRPERRDA